MPLLFGTTLLAWSVSACGGRVGGGGGASGFSLDEASNGFGRLLPYEVERLDASGNPSGQVIEIRRIQDLVANVRPTNPVRSAATWPEEAILPNGAAGNQYLSVSFTAALDPSVVLDAALSSPPGSLGAAILVESVDPLTDTIVPVAGRAFVGGQTYGAPDPDAPGARRLERWIGLANGAPAALDVDGERPGFGFPGTEGSGGFAGSGGLVSDRTLVFVPDADGDLSTFETFPRGVQIRVRISAATRSLQGQSLRDVGVGTSTVGTDLFAPEVATSGANALPAIVPGNGELDVDPSTSITVQFTEPVQPASIGEFDDGTSPHLSSALTLEFGPSTGRVQVPFHVRALSPYDLSTLELVPIYAFPGSGPELDGPSCGAFGAVDVRVNAGQFQDFATNANTRSPATSFVTAEGAGMVNAPVAPDSIYILRAGANPALSVLDLNGFGQGPGNPAWDPLNPIVEGNSNFGNDPNVRLQASAMTPPLSLGTCTFDGGSSGVFSLARDSSMRDRLVASPQLSSPVDMALGHALDSSFNAALPFGCQAGGGNLCAQTGLKLAQLTTGGPNTLKPIGPTETPTLTLIAPENLLAFAPHPNPPPLIFPPLCLSPLIAAQEPTSVDTAVPNLLVPGNAPLGRPDLGLPPDGLLTQEQNVFFQGPSLPQPAITACSNYGVRQQIGHYLYVADRRANELVVLNSNRMSVLDRISMPDPAGLAMSPNVDLLAVTNGGADLVSFVDVDPTSSTFHQIVKRTTVGSQPGGIAWEPGNEDIFVCNTGEDSVSILSARSLEVRKTVTNLIQDPIDVAITPRQTTFGFARNVYFAYILNGDGSIAVFESGPDGVNGWGYDDVIGSPPFRFTKPKTIQPDPTDLRSAVWVVHEEPLDGQGLATGQPGGAVSKLVIQSATTGQIPLGTNSGSPRIRDIQWAVAASIGEGPNGLTGIPTDIAFDNQRNLTPYPNFTTVFSAGTPATVNGRSLVRTVTATVVPTSAPQFAFVCVPASSEGAGTIDVLDLSGLRRTDTNPFQEGIQSVPCSDAIGLMDILRQ